MRNSLFVIFMSVTLHIIIRPSNVYLEAIASRWLKPPGRVGLNEVNGYVGGNNDLEVGQQLM